MSIQFVMTMAGNCPLLAFLILERIYGEKITAKTYIRILRISVLFYLIPFQRIKFFLPIGLLNFLDKGLEIRNYILDKTQFRYLQVFVEGSTYYQFPELYALVFAVCALIFLVILGIRIRDYFAIRRSLVYNADEISWAEAVSSDGSGKERKNKIRLYESQRVSTPCTTGIFHPCIIIPEHAYEEREKEWVIGHEMGHILHRDILWKFLCMVCCALHWYNIFVYVLLYEYSCYCEYYCDEYNMAGRSKEEKKDYGIYIVKQSAGDGGLFRTIQELTFGGKNMKKRLRWLLSEKKKGVLVPIVMAAALLMSSMTVFAYSSYKEAEIPIDDGEYVLGMEYSDNPDFVVAMETSGEENIDDLEQIDFCGASRIFREEGTNEYIALEEHGSSDYLLCLHSWAHGYIYIHKDLSGGRCQVRKYEGDVCRKCQSERNMVLRATITYEQCPH